MTKRHSPSGSREYSIKEKIIRAAAIVGLGTSALAAVLSGCSGEKAAAQSDHPESTSEITTSAPANPTQPESTGIIPEKVCYTDPATGETETQDNAAKMDRAVIEASAVYTEGACAEDLQSTPMGFELNYDRFVGWESKTEAQKDLERERTFQESGMVTLFNEQYEDSFMVIGEKGGGDGPGQFTPQQWAEYVCQRLAVVNAVRNDKGDPRNEEIAHHLAEGLFVQGTSDAELFLEDFWESVDLRRKGTFLQFKEETLTVTGAAKPYTEPDGTVIYMLRTEAESIHDNDPIAKNGKRHIVIAFSPITHVDVEDRRTTTTIRIYETWTEGIHDMPDIEFFDK